MNMHFVYPFLADEHWSRGEYSGPCKEGGQSPRRGGEGAVRAEQRLDWGVMTGEGWEGPGGWRGWKVDPPTLPAEKRPVDPSGSTVAVILMASASVQRN